VRGNRDSGWELGIAFQPRLLRLRCTTSKL
jgi:hypothetical protein